MQIFPAQDIGARFGRGFKPAFEKGLNRFLDKQESEEQFQRKVDIQKGKQQFDAQESMEEYQTVNKFFGEEAADLWKVLPANGKVALFHDLLEANQRGENVGKVIREYQKEGGRPRGEEQLEESVELEEKVTPGKAQIDIETQEKVTKPRLTAQGKLPEDFKLPDYSKRQKGYTSKEWADKRKEWSKANTATSEKISDEKKATQRNLLSTKNLKRLNETGNVAEGFQRLLINPNTGDFYGLAQLAQLPSKEAQEWVKEIARFGNRAKDAFGSRVTNFDLQQYLKQFPSLLNSYEGRKRILDMMEINYQIDNLYNSALDEIYDRAELDGIPPNKAKKRARELIEDQVQELENRYLLLDEKNQEEILQKNVGPPPKGYVRLLDPNGNPLNVKEEEVEKVIQLGARRPNE